jgi:hypothetical protein
MGLEHKHPHCTGLWDQQGSGACMYWRAEQCDAIADHSIEVADAALQEKWPDTMLRQLANAGDWLRADEEENLAW